MCGCETPSDERKVFSAVALETSYQSSGVTVVSDIEVRSNDKFTLICQYDKGSAETGNVCEVEIAFSADGTNFAIYGQWADGGSGQLAYTPSYFNVAQDQYAVINIEGLGRYMRIRLKEEGVAAVAGTFTGWLYRNKS